MTSFFSESELAQIGFKHVGVGVKISRYTRIYYPNNISVGNYSRIDDFSILSAGKEIVVGSNVHVAVYCLLMGGESIVLEDYSNLSSRVTIYSSTDDFSGNYMTNPTNSETFTNVISKPVYVKRHVVVGTGSVIMPGVTLHEGVAIGAMSFVKDDCEEFKVYAGVPSKYIKNRSKKLLDFENKQ